MKILTNDFEEFLVHFRTNMIKKIFCHEMDYNREILRGPSDYFSKNGNLVLEITSGGLIIELSNNIMYRFLVNHSYGSYCLTIDMIEKCGKEFVDLKILNFDSIEKIIGRELNEVYPELLRGTNRTVLRKIVFEFEDFDQFAIIAEDNLYSTKNYGLAFHDGAWLVVDKDIIDINSKYQYG